jgi:hypothetical protein
MPILPEQKFYTWNRNRYAYGDDAETDVNFTLGGTVLDNLHLFTSGRWFETYGRFPGEYRKSFDLTVRPTFDLGNNMRIYALGLLEDRGEIFGWKNRRYSDLWRFFLEGVPVYDGYSSVASVRFSHVISPQTYYDIQIGHTMQSNRQGFVDQDGDGMIRWGEWDGDFIRFETADEIAKYIGSHIREDSQREKFFATQFTDDFSRVFLRWSGNRMAACPTHPIIRGSKNRKHSISRRYHNPGNTKSPAPWGCSDAAI